MSWLSDWYKKLGESWSGYSERERNRADQARDRDAFAADLATQAAAKRKAERDNALAATKTPPPVIADATNPIEIESSRIKKMKAMRRGLLSTVRTSPQGSTGKGPELNTPAGQMFSSTKTTLGA